MFRNAFEQRATLCIGNRLLKRAINHIFSCIDAEDMICVLRNEVQQRHIAETLRATNGDRATVWWSRNTRFLIEYISPAAAVVQTYAMCVCALLCYRQCTDMTGVTGLWLSLPDLWTADNISPILFDCSGSSEVTSTYSALLMRVYKWTLLTNLHNILMLSLHYSE